MKSLTIANLALLFLAGAMTAITVAPSAANAYYYHHHYYRYHWHGRYYGHRHCHYYPHRCRYW